MSGTATIFTIDASQGMALGTTPGHSGVVVNTMRQGAGAPAETFLWLLENGAGYFRLENDAGDFELEIGP